ALAAELVAEHERALPVGRAKRALAVVVLDVRAAEAAGKHADDDLVGARLRLGHVLEPQVLLLVEDGRLHRATAAGWRTCRSRRSFRNGRPSHVSCHAFEPIGIESTAHHSPSYASASTGISSSKSMIPSPKLHFVPNMFRWVFMSVSHRWMWPIEPSGSSLMNSIWSGSVSAGCTWLCPITPQAWKWPVSYMSLKFG